MFDWKKHQVCFATGPADTYVLLAIRPARLPNEGGPGETVVWDDGSHQRAFELARIQSDEPARFRFEDHLGRRFALRPLTAQLYADQVRRLVGGPDLPTDDAVREFYLAPRPW